VSRALAWTVLIVGDGERPVAVKIGLVNANIGSPLSGARTIAGVQLAEQLGLESVWVADHIAVPRRIDSSYPYDPSGRAPVSLTNKDYPNPLLWLAYGAGVTSRISLATGVMVVALQNPLVIAKQVATLGVMSQPYTTITSTLTG
jgi:alkanesulfonate monooxygenase SsuD/methylene tetrahydromethanopterin reductase-like flavin-dependent oxidoreductase (luciferase family)